MKIVRFASLFGLVVACCSTASAALVVLDDFNTNEGRFGLAPTFSGSTTGLAATSTADRITTDSYEGAGSEQLVFIDDATPGGASRVRFLSGGGSAGGASGQPANTVIPVTAGTDGWLGFVLKTTTPGWNVQIWIEGPENNGSSQKTVIADGNWHLYAWNLDDETGGPDGWQATGVPGIIGGDIDVQTGNYTIDSILFRHTAMPATSTILLDFVGLNVPEPNSFALGALGLIGAFAARRRVA
jgi:hypothetical protein